ncbi:MAG: hypothetical protein H6767_04435 [Candidatus Peribacteria bacterium]|nr:MAG: hypothetical protein H6767_04435 [Candidatus Peribacteria bacterium]
MQVDHGIWMVLKKMFPNNDKKACIITINMQAMSEEYFGIGEKLQAFREKGYMIFCSGNIVHNFDFIDSNSEAIYPWAREFNELIASHILSRNFDTIINYQGLKDYEKAFKTKEHFAPLIFAI